MGERDPLSEAFVAAYERMPLWRRDQFDACMREAVVVINQIAAWMADNLDALTPPTADPRPTHTHELEER